MSELDIIIIFLFLLVIYLLPKIKLNKSSRYYNQSKKVYKTRQCTCGVVYRTDVYTLCPVCCPSNKLNQ